MTQEKYKVETFGENPSLQRAVQAIADEAWHSRDAEVAAITKEKDFWKSEAHNRAHPDALEVSQATVARLVEAAEKVAWTMGSIASIRHLKDTIAAAKEASHQAKGR